MQKIVEGWVEHDAAGAERWSLALPDGPLKASALASVIIADAAGNLPHALELARATNSLG